MVGNCFSRAEHRGDKKICGNCHWFHLFNTCTLKQLQPKYVQALVSVALRHKNVWKQRQPPMINPESQTRHLLGCTVVPFCALDSCKVSDHMQILQNTFEIPWDKQTECKAQEITPWTIQLDRTGSNRSDKWVHQQVNRVFMVQKIQKMRNQQLINHYNNGIISNNINNG